MKFEFVANTLVFSEPMLNIFPAMAGLLVCLGLVWCALFTKGWEEGPYSRDVRRVAGLSVIAMAFLLGWIVFTLSHTIRIGPDEIREVAFMQGLTFRVDKVISWDTADEVQYDHKVFTNDDGEQYVRERLNFREGRIRIEMDLKKLTDFEIETIADYVAEYATKEALKMRKSVFRERFATRHLRR